MRRGWRAILSEGVSEGVFEVVDIKVATFAILALLTGLCTWYRPGGRLTKEAIIAAHEKLVLSGVSPQAATRPCPQHPQATARCMRLAAATLERGRAAMTANHEPLDDIDLKILSELQKDGRIRINELASRVGLSLPPCLRRVRSLREPRRMSTAIRATIDEKAARLRGRVVRIRSSWRARPRRRWKRSKPRLRPCRWSCKAGAFREKRTIYSNASRQMSRACISSFGSLPRCPRSATIRSLPVLGVAKDAPLADPQGIRARLRNRVRVGIQRFT